MSNKSNKFKWFEDLFGVAAETQADKAAKKAQQDGNEAKQKAPAPPTPPTPPAGLSVADVLASPEFTAKIAAMLDERLKPEDPNEVAKVRDILTTAAKEVAEAASKTAVEKALSDAKLSSTQAEVEKLTNLVNSLSDVVKSLKDGLPASGRVDEAGDGKNTKDASVSSQKSDDLAEAMGRGLANAKEGLK